MIRRPQEFIVFTFLNVPKFELHSVRCYFKVNREGLGEKSYGLSGSECHCGKQEVDHQYAPEIVENIGRRSISHGVYVNKVCVGWVFAMDDYKLSEP